MPHIENAKQQVPDVILEAVGDPRFQNFSPSTKAEMLTKIDPNFGGRFSKLSPQGQLTILRKLTRGRISGAPTPPSLTVGKVASGAISNFPESFGSAVENIYKMIIHPIDTAKSLGNLAVGGLELLVPAAEAPTSERDIRNIPQTEQAALDFSKYAVDRYGGVENFKRTIATDPVGFLMDASAFLGGGGAVTRAVGLSRTGGLIGKVGRAIDPVLGAARVVKKGTKITGKFAGSVAGETIGITTGAGRKAIQEAYNVEFPRIGTFKGPLDFWRKTRELNKGFRDAISGKIGEIEIFKEASRAMDNIVTARTDEYLKGLRVLKNSEATVNLSPIIEKMGLLQEKFNIKGNLAELLKDPKMLGAALRKSTFSKLDYGIVKEAFRSVDDWMLDTSLHTPYGMDILKRKLDSLWNQNKTSRAFISSLRDTVKDIVVKGMAKDAPQYLKMQKSFSDFSNIIEEIQNTIKLKVSGKVNADSVLNKLTSALSSNKEFRRSIVDLLEKHSGVELTQSIAGHLLEPRLPSGPLGRVITGVGVLSSGLSGILGAQFMGILLMGSPRAMGRLTRVLGSAMAPITAVGRRIPSATGQVAFQLGRTADVTSRDDVTRNRARIRP